MNNGLVNGLPFCISTICVDRDNDIHLVSVQVKNKNKRFKFKLGQVQPANVAKLLFASEVIIKCTEDSYTG